MERMTMSREAVEAVMALVLADDAGAEARAMDDAALGRAAGALEGREGGVAGVLGAVVALEAARRFRVLADAEEERAKVQAPGAE